MGVRFFERACADSKGIRQNEKEPAEVTKRFVEDPTVLR